MKRKNKQMGVIGLGHRLPAPLADVEQRRIAIRLGEPLPTHCRKCQKETLRLHGRELHCTPRLAGCGATYLIVDADARPTVVAPLGVYERRTTMKHVRLLTVLVIALLGAGCAAPLTKQAVTLVAPDVKAAVKVLTASEALLPDHDPWLVCLTNLDTLGTYLAAGPGLDVPECAGRPCILTEAARLHVLDTVARTLPPALKAACGQLLLELMIRAGSRAPGL